MSRKLEEKKQRRLAEEARKARKRKSQQRANLITVGIAVVVLGVVVALVVVQRNEQAPEENVGVRAAAANCTDIESHPEEGNQHVNAGTPVDYQSNPPTTGNHWPPDQIATSGFHTEQVEPERLVHNQEHGQVVIWYSPNAPQEVKDQIAEITAQEEEATIAVPWSEVPSPYTFSISAWSGEDNEGKSQSCEQVSQEVVDEFRSQYQGRGPEQVGIPLF